ncbi:integrase core domain-containing protein [Rhodobacter sp. 24-YEA-8]|uniref:integrase core domain-containing protein n=1 Tax=Rhodobacter sp. 24-YEA-8 TaxID=1884310 RepID=UPI001C0CE303
MGEGASREELSGFPPPDVAGQRFDSIQHASRAIGDWSSFYNNRRPHQALAMRSPAEAFRIAA